MKIAWEKQTGKYQYGEDCRVGKVVVGYASYSALVSANDPLKFECTTLLPGIAKAKERYATI